MTASTDLDDTLANIRARAEAATPGPWDIWLGAGWVILAPDGHREIARTPEPCRENAVFITHARADIELLLNLVADLRSRIGCVVEATHWDRPYDTRIAAIRGMCDLATDGMTPALDGDTTTTDGAAVHEGDTHA